VTSTFPRQALFGSPTTSRSKAAGHRGIGVIGVVWCVTGALVVSGCADLGVQSHAHEAAASFADTSLLQALQEAAQAADPDGRLVAVAEQLDEPDDELRFLDGGGNWVVESAEGASITVSVYYYWEDKSFSASQAWGLACREYTVAETVTVTSVECASDVPSTPLLSELVGW